MELYITRHGQTKANVEKYMQGQTPGELTKEGCEQAKKFGIFYKNIKFDEVYCSDLLRAKKSLEIILNENLYKDQYKDIITYTEKLREINCKSLEYQPCSKYANLKSNPPGRYRFISTDPKDETYIDIFYRISLFLDDLIKKNISPYYSSGIIKENVYNLNEQCDKISPEQMITLWKEKKLSINAHNNNNDKNLKKILIMCHGGAIAEIMNNILYRMKKIVNIKRVISNNTGLFLIQIYKKEFKEEKNKDKEISNDDDLVFNFKLFNDTSHLKEINKIE